MCGAAELAQVVDAVRGRLYAIFCMEALNKFRSSVSSTLGIGNRQSRWLSFCNRCGMRRFNYDA